MIYIKNLMRFLTFIVVCLSIYSVGYVQAMNNDSVGYVQAMNNDIELIKKRNINFFFNKNGSLRKAIQKRNLEKVKDLLDKKADVNIVDYGCNTPLHVACSNNVPIEIIKCLVENKANLNTQGLFDGTPLHIAISEDNFEIIQYLVESKTNLNLLGKHDNAPLHQAISRENPSIKIIQYLIDNKSDVNWGNKSNRTPLWVAISRNKPSMEIVKCLLENKSDINIKSNDMNFWKFLVESHSKNIKSLNESGAVDFRIKDCEGKTILDYAQGKECYNDILNLTRKWRTLEETQKVETLLRVLYVLRTEQSPVFKVPKPILEIIFKLAGIPTHGKSIKLFDC